MEKRRQRILFEARRVIAQDGFDALTTRGLAQAAGVTQPTLYNLIGSKDDILRALLVESVGRVWDRLSRTQAPTALAAVEAVAIESIGLFESDIPYYRAAILAGDRLEGALIAPAGQDEQRFFVGRESVRMATQAAERAIAEGLLNGRLSAQTLGEQMYTCYRGPMRDWAYGYISLKDFETRALRGFYMVMAADASPDFHNQLSEKLVALERQASPAATVQTN